jgi:hypothetical protein
VLVGAREQEGGLAAQLVPACQRVGQHRGVQVPDVRRLRAPVSQAGGGGGAGARRAAGRGTALT